MSAQDDCDILNHNLSCSSVHAVFHITETRWLLLFIVSNRKCTWWTNIRQITNYCPREFAFKRQEQV